MTEHFEGMHVRPENHIPHKLFTAGKTLMCNWLTLDGGRFAEPFFDNTEARCRHWAAGQKQHPPGATSLQTMLFTAKALAAVNPSAVIFHLSRCGSTLVSQALASSPRFCVLSEVSFFDELLRHEDIAAEQIAELLPAALRFYGLKRHDTEEHVIIKTDCWHIFFYHALREIFPNVPFVLLYRRPEEVFRSLNQKPGRQIIPELVDPKIFGLPGMPDPYEKDIYTATIIEKMLAKFLEVAAADTQTLLVNYKEGPLNMVKKIAAFANLALSEDELADVEVRSRYHSKKPGELFGEEPAAGVPACLDEAMRLYELLEQKRNLDDCR